ncbi:O-antigen ligase family protein [Bacillus sp. sid0103]|uniref:O-antigen ligase family protein n=1 Tax=Bacillus sp. sid0103 TaxID=2856337 RepID=UPI001C48CA9A|nr:O-antigen ligase family protein [Bacillus sp. sid0103]MBV7505574.1 O-antigen ligase family protein [Bacillus sp. sid0103]
MYQMKNYFSKTMLIALLSLLLGCMAVYLTVFIHIPNNTIYPVILFAFIGAAGFVVLFLLKWEKLLFLFALSVGFQLNDPSPYEIMFCLMILLFLVKRIPFNREMLNNFLLLMLFLFVLFGTFSIFFSINIHKAAAWHLITVYLVLSAFSLVLIIKNDKQLVYFLKGYVVGAVVNSMLGVIGYLAGKSQGRGNRLEGFFQDPNIFSPFVVIAILLVIEDSVAPNLFKSKIFKFLSIVLMVGALVLAMSRAGWINFAIALALYAGVKILKRQLRLGFVIKFLLVPFSVLLSIPFIFPGLNFMNQLKDRTTLQSYDNDRFGANYFTLKVAENHPFGIGPGEITSIYYMDTHNTYLRLFAEYGWFSGIFLILFFLFLTGVLLKRSLSHDRRDFNLYLVLLCSLVGTLVNIIVVDALHWRHFWVLIALCYYLIFFKKEPATALKGEIQ